MACPSDFTFGAVLPTWETGCRAFDFRIVFEDAFLVLAPSLAILPVLAGRIGSIFRRPKVVEWPTIRNLKLILYAILGSLQLAELGLYASRAGYITSRATLPAYAFLLVSTVGLALLSALEHTSSPGPSVILQAYLLLTLFFDAAVLRTRWLLPGEHTIASLQSTTFALKLAILILESVSKGAHLPKSNASEFSPDEKAGFFGKSLLLWLNPLFLKGYRSKLSEADLFPMGQQLTASKLTEELDVAWKHTKSGRKRRLAIALTKAFWSQLLFINLPRLALVGFSVAQPVLVQAALSYMTNNRTEPAQFGSGLIGAFALNYIGVAFSTVWYQHQTFRLMVMIRGSLIGMIFRHSLSLPGSEEDGSSDAVSLASTDIERIVQTLQWSLNIIPNAVQVGIGLWILETYLGAVCVAPVVVAIACGVVAGNVGKRIPPRQRRWMQAIQKRIKVTTKAVGEIKSIKMTGLVGVVAQQIQGLRVSEINDQKAFRRVQITNIAVGNTPAMLTAAVTFTAFSIVQLVQPAGQLDVVRAYASLSLLSILIDPVAELVTATTNLASSLSSLDRIQEFLQRAAQQDERSFLELSDSRSRSSPSPSTGLELQPVGDQSLRALGSAPKHSRSTIVRIASGTFGWNHDKVILQNIDLEILSSTFTIITGPVGSGKSALLRSMLGETCILSGTVECASPKQIAYCDQEPWILNISLEENILGVSPYDEERYQTVIDACQLTHDVAQLPEGDKTLAGSKGMSLSGGQKQRISLARAAYSGKQLIVMDDTLAGLDSATSSRCFEALLGKSGLFRKDGRTVVFATHNPQWLSHADDILVLTDGGQITGRGNLQTLRETNEYIRQLYSGKNKPTDIGDIEESSRTPAILGPGSKAKESPKDAATTVAASAQDSDAVLEAVGQQKPPTKTGAFRYYIKSLGSEAILGFALLCLCLVGCNTAQPLWLKYWVADNEKHPNENVGMWAGVYMAFAVGAIMFIALETGYMLLVLVPRSARNLHQKLLYATLSAPLSFIASKDTGTIVNHLTGDLNLTDMALPLSFILGSERLVSAVAEIILTCIASGWLALSIPVLAAVLYFLQRIYLKTSRQLRVLELELKAPMFSNFIGTFSGLVTIRAFSWTSAIEQENLKLLDRSQRPYYLLFCLQRWLTLVLDLTTAGLATLLMGLAVALREKIDPGFLGVALVSVMSLGGTLSAMIVNWTNFETSLGAITRIRNYVDTTPAEAEQEEREDAEGGNERWPPRGEVVFRNVSASYRKNGRGARHSVLDDIDLTIAAGSKVAVCGRTGSGKSTLLALVLRLLEPDTGSITVDGVDLSTVSADRIRTSLVALSQDPFFLSGCSVRMNLDPFGKYSSSGDKDGPLLGALEKTGLAALIAERGGLDEELKLEWLSTGQRQLFCMARAMLRDSQVLLLDEATSHLDAQTEKLINQLIQTEFRGWTVLAVTHHVKSVAERETGFDQVVVLQDGRIAEQGSPASLLQTTNGVFREMVDMHGSTSVMEI